MMDVLSAGVSIHTNLPTIAPEMLIGRHFNLLVGQSSFGAAAGPVQQLRCEIVGISDQVGLGGPTIPLDVLQDFSPTPLRCHTATLELDSAQRAPEIEARLREMGLEAPGMNLARQIGAGIFWVRAVLAAFGAALLLVAAMSLYAGLSLQVREEESTLGLYRALGASGRDLLALFLVRAGMLGLVGSVTGLAFGLLAGAWVGRGIASLSGEGSGALPQIFQPDLLTTSGFVVFGVGTCLAAGFLPARRASRLSPAEVLRR
jgi:ABC-type lipoprotein release transport system permease subunit